RTLGFANHLYRSTTPGKVWLVSSGVTPNGTAREVDTSGTDTAPVRDLLAGFVPEASVERGLLGVMQAQEPAVPWFAVWDPIRGTRKVADGDAFFAATGHTLVTSAGSPSPARGTPLRVVDLVTGSTRDVQAPRGTFFDGTGV